MMNCNSSARLERHLPKLFGAVRRAVARIKSDRHAAVPSPRRAIERKWFTMRMSDRLSGRFTAAVLAAGLLVSVSTGAGAAPPEFKSTQDALEQGVNAYGGRYYLP